MGSNRTSVSIRWEAPEADGGSPVTSYQVELRPKSKAGLAGMTDEWLTVYQVSEKRTSLGYSPHASSSVTGFSQECLALETNEKNWMRLETSELHCTCVLTVL